MAHLLFTKIFSILLILNLVYSVPITINTPNGTNATLKYIQIVFRHGARSPLQYLPNDPIGAAYWNKYGGLGQLLPVGTKQEYDLGTFIKNYYNSFLSNSYDRSKVYSRSTDIDRTLISSYAFLAAMYQPNADQIWNRDLNWLPIPVHTTMTQIDPLFPSATPCQAFDYLRNKTLNSSSYLKLANENKGFVQNMSALSGLNLSYYDIWKLADVILSEQAQNLSLPLWAQQNYDKIISIKDYTYMVDYGTVEQAIFYGSGLLTEVRNNFMKIANGSSSLEISTYANHDSFMGAFLSLLNFTWPLKQVPFGGAVVFELYQENVKNGTYYVQLLFKNTSLYDPTIKLNPVKMNDCDQLCPLNKFLEITSDKVLSDRAEACNLYNGPDQFNNGFSIFNSAKSYFWKIMVLLAITKINLLTY